MIIQLTPHRDFLGNRSHQVSQAFLYYLLSLGYLFLQQL
jgi:hypothetical protein